MRKNVKPVNMFHVDTDESIANYIRILIAVGLKPREIMAAGAVRYPQTPWSPSYISHYVCKMGLSRPNAKTLVKKGQLPLFPVKK